MADITIQDDRTGWREKQNVPLRLDDYNPEFYDPSIPTTYIENTARWAVQKAMEAGGGEITFDTTVDLDIDNPNHESYFGGPIDEFNSIILEFGELAIFDHNGGDWDFDGDGSVSASDFIQFRMRFGGSI